jgi:hypothetical protein
MDIVIAKLVIFTDPLGLNTALLVEIVLKDLIIIVP